MADQEGRKVINLEEENVKDGPPVYGLGDIAVSSQMIKHNAAYLLDYCDDLLNEDFLKDPLTKTGGIRCFQSADNKLEGNSIDFGYLY